MGTVDLIQIIRDGVIIYDHAPFNGLEQDCAFSSSGTYVYSIEASNSAGQSDSRTASVVVKASQPQNPLAGTQWQLISYASSQGSTTVIENTIVSAAFLEDYEIAGIGGCNTYSGQYIVDGAALQIYNLTSGRVNCPQPVGLMEQEATYFALLETVATYQISGTQLLLSNATGQVILTYEEVLATPF